MQEVIKKETIKLLDAGVIFPIADSQWVSPVQCISKKGGITVVPNEKAKLVATRPITGWHVCMAIGSLILGLNKIISHHLLIKCLIGLQERGGIAFLMEISGTNKSPLHQRIEKRQHLYALMAPSNPSECPLDYVIPQLPFNDVVSKAIKDFSKIVISLCRLLEKERTFVFDTSCMVAFKTLKEKLVSTTIIIAPDWNLSFEMMCDASGLALGAMLGQRKNKFEADARLAEEKDIDDVFPDETVPATEANHVPWVEPRTIGLVCGLGTQNSLRSWNHGLTNGLSITPRSVDHNPKFEFLTTNYGLAGRTVNQTTVRRAGSMSQQFAVILRGRIIVEAKLEDWLLPEDLSSHQLRKFLFDVKKYIWDEPFVCRECIDNIIWCCVREVEVNEILRACHVSLAGGHHGGIGTTTKVLQCGYYWPTMFRDAHAFCNCCV
ncbi:hypothetical protein MTR67_023256 [Solanum verrucosum]|uniref:Reverse transcriptase/retrotransposon-derived protein RNase H-like domain-containing protein n=1 Tax=Solanum verrucosum TaxID=315347 RepID=A0AAF0TRN6_SOLVR|nr:hypothetical protein MTR67_023256 [Solanum verrucosum]